jgi:hypothetical protein
LALKVIIFHFCVSIDDQHIQLSYIGKNINVY